MKTLPDTPNLDHLRQQAKDLLVQLRAARPGATLSDAQTLVAERYGFRAWPDLKAEVDRRCAAPPTADDAVPAALAEFFDLGVPHGPLVAVERQWAGQAWALTTDRGRWLARRLFDWFNESNLETEALLAESAAASGVQTLRPVRSRTGTVAETVAGERWRVYHLPALGPEPTLPADPRHAAAAGRIIARVHRLALPAPHPVAPWLTCVRSESLWWELQRAAEAAGKPWAPQLAETIPALVEASAVVEPVTAATATVLSGCYYATAAFRVTGPDDLAVVTWEHAGATPPGWDLGGALVGWSEGIPGGINGAAVRALVSGYAEVADVPRPLGLGLFSAAVCADHSWLASRIRIALETDSEAQRREVADQSVPWLLARPLSRPKLEAILDALG